MDGAEFALRLTITLVLIAVWLGVVGGVLSLIHLVISLPMKRAARAGLFLDLVETSLRAGEPVEPALVSIARTGDRTLGARFHLIAARIQQGLRLAEALATVPQFLPPAITAMFAVGQKIGDLGKILPACRQHLKDAQSQVRSAINYLFILAFVITPASVVIFTILSIKVFPSVHAIAEGLGTPTEPTGVRFLLDYRVPIVLVQVFLMAIIWFMAILYALGPRTASSLPLIDSIYYRLPWRRKRMQRDFSAILAVLLDSHVPEPEALRLAAECAASRQFEKHACQAGERLKRGMKLTEAVEAVDDSGEFRWRLTNATHAHGGFLSALAGWHEALDAKAFQQEQAAAHSVTTGLVLLNGLFVGAVVVSVFAFLVSIVDAGLLW
jgi:general secretion pathway protein F